MRKRSTRPCICSSVDNSVGAKYVSILENVAEHRLSFERKLIAISSTSDCFSSEYNRTFRNKLKVSMCSYEIEFRETTA